MWQMGLSTTHPSTTMLLRGDKRRLTIFFQTTQPGAEIPMEAAIDEYNVFHVHPAAIKSKEEVKEFFNLLAVYIADSQRSRM